MTKDLDNLRHLEKETAQIQREKQQQISKKFIGQKVETLSYTREI